MKTTEKIIIERRESGCLRWSYFTGKNAGIKGEEEARCAVALAAFSYPQHRFRAVKVTETREVLQNPC